MYSLAPDGSTVRSDNLFLSFFSLTVNNMSHQYSVVEKRRQPPGFQFEGRRRRRTYFAYHARAPPGRWGLSDESDDHHIGGCSSRAWAEEAHSSGDAFSVGKFPGVTSPDEAFSARCVASRVCSSVVRVRGFANASLALLVRVSPRQTRRFPKHRSSRARSTAGAAGLAACENHSEQGGGVTRAAGASCVWDDVYRGSRKPSVRAGRPPSRSRSLSGPWPRACTVCVLAVRQVFSPSI